MIAASRAHASRVRVVNVKPITKMSNEQPPRQHPTILITGTPGTGKSTHAALLAQQVHLNHVNVGDLVKEKGLHEGFDEEWQSYTVDEDKV